MKARTKMYLNLGWANRSHDKVNNKSYSTCVDQKLSMPGKTQTPCIPAQIKKTQHLLTKHLPCRLGSKIHLYFSRHNTSLSWEHKKCFSVVTKPSNVNDNTKCIWTCVDQIYPMPARISPLVLTKPLSWQQRDKIFLNLCWPNPEHASEDTICI